MLHWLFILFLLLFSPIKSYGFGWGDVGECITDPCNCGHGRRNETWGGVTKNKGDEDYNCPPYNKTDGRTSCLKQFPWIKAGSQFYHEVCAEEAPGSTYGNPKIRIRSQACNGAACWTVREDLKWNGQCVVLGGPYGVPMKRVCARVAVKRYTTDENGNEVVDSTDQGYDDFANKHIDHEGFTVDDETIYDHEGNPFTDLNPPKLCAYSDPSSWTLNTYDPMDIGLNKQSLHETDATHPIIEALKGLIELSASINTSFSDLNSQLFDLLGDALHIETVTDVLSDVMGHINFVREWLGENVFINLLDTFGKLNGVVDSSPKTYGCVNIPLGPMPPPFPNALEASAAIGPSQYVCPMNQASGQNPILPIKSTFLNPCVVSERKNNLINNVIRVGFDNFVPLCEGNENPMETDKCVRIENYSAFSNPEIIHTLTLLGDIIKHCDDATPGEPCVKSKIPHTCSVTEYGCQNGFRVSYAMKMGKRAVPSNYFLHDIPPCADGSSPCQLVWGINTGEFYDIAVQFPEIETQYSAVNLQESAILKNKNGEAVTFTAKITRAVPQTPSGTDILEETNQICLLEGNKIIGCENRAYPVAQLCDVDSGSGVIEDQLCYSVTDDKIEKYKYVPVAKTKVYECGYNGITCSPDSSFFRPKVILSTNIDGFYSSSVFEVLNTYSKDTNTAHQMNHLGREFDSFATNDDMRVMPFEGSDAPSDNSLFGVYLNDIMPYDFATDIPNPAAVYLNGLEYIKGQYSAGGTNICISPSGLKQCPEDPTMCVLTNLLERDDVACDEFMLKLQEYSDLKPCSVEFTGCSSVYTFIGTAIDINSCDQGYCYNSPGGKELCVISTEPADRHDPPGPMETLNESQYFDINGAGANSYDKKLYALRSKTTRERSLCAAIPQPKCNAVTGYPASDGNANWPESDVGELANGTCQPNYLPTGNLTRYCLANQATETVAFGSITGGASCQPAQCTNKYYGTHYLVGNFRNPPYPLNEGQTGYTWCTSGGVITGYTYSAQCQNINGTLDITRPSCFNSIHNGQRVVDVLASPDYN